MTSHLSVVLVLLFMCSYSETVVLFNPFNPFENRPTSTRAPIPIDPFFYHIMLPESSSSTIATSSQTNAGTTTGTTTPSTTVTSTFPTTKLPPNFCTTSSDCPAGSCCRDLNNQILLMSEVFDVTGPYGSRPLRNGTCSSSRAQLGERCNDFCACELGMTCFRDVNKPCCSPAVCQYQTALEKNMQLWMRCFEDDKCEVFEDSSEEDDDSKELANSTVTARKFKVPTHLVPTVRTLIAKQRKEKDERDDDDSDDIDQKFSKLFNDTLITNITNALLKDDDSDEDTDSKEDDELSILLMGLIKGLMNQTTLTPNSTTPPPIFTTTDSLVSLFSNTQKHTANTLFNTKSILLNNHIDIKQKTTNQASVQSQTQQIMNLLNAANGAASQSNSMQNSLHTVNNVFNGQSSSVQTSGMNTQLHEIANSETMKILNALQLVQTGGSFTNTIQGAMGSATPLDPLAAAIAETIATQLMPPTPLPSSQQMGGALSGLGKQQSQIGFGLQKQKPGFSIQQPLPGGGNLNLHINSQQIVTTTPTLPDFNFLASNVAPSSQLAPKLKRLQALLAKKKAAKAAAAIIRPTYSPTTVSTPQSQAVPDVIKLMAMKQMLQQSSGNNQQVMNMLNMGLKKQTSNSKQSQFQTNLQMNAMLNAIGANPITTTPGPTVSQQNSIQNINAVNARQAMEILKLIKKRKSIKKSKKTKISKSTAGKQILNLNKKVVNSLMIKDSSTRKAIKQLQALRMVKGQNASNSNGTRTEEDVDDFTDEIDDSDENSNSTENVIYTIQNGTLKAVKLNKTADDDDSDESDEEISMLMLDILSEINGRPTTRRPTTTTTTPSTTTVTSTIPDTTTTIQITTPTTTTDLFLSNMLSQRNSVTSQKSTLSHNLDLKSLSWNDVVNYFKSKQAGKI